MKFTCPAGKSCLSVLILVLIPKKTASKAKFAQTFIFLHGNFTPFMCKSFQIRDHFFPLLFPKDSENLNFLDIGLRKVGEKKTFKWSEQMKKSVKHFLSITFYQGFHISKKFGHRTLGSGGEKKRETEWDSVTDKHTDRHTNMLTYRKNRPRGSILWKRPSTPPPPKKQTIFLVFQFDYKKFHSTLF